MEELGEAPNSVKSEESSQRWCEALNEREIMELAPDYSNLREVAVALVPVAESVFGQEWNDGQLAYTVFRFKYWRQGLSLAQTKPPSYDQWKHILSLITAVDSGDGIPGTSELEQE